MYVRITRQIIWEHPWLEVHYKFGLYYADDAERKRFLASEEGWIPAGSPNLVGSNYDDREALLEDDNLAQDQVHEPSPLAAQTLQLLCQRPSQQYDRKRRAHQLIESSKAPSSYNTRAAEKAVKNSVGDGIGGAATNGLEKMDLD